MASAYVSRREPMAELKVEDSNMANVGTAEDRAKRKEIAMGEKEWRNADGLPAGSTFLWKVNNERRGHFGVKAVKDFDGSLFLGDAYIALSAGNGDRRGGVDAATAARYKETFNWKNADYKRGENVLDIFYWLGPDCTIDEQAVAAIKTVELDSYLDGRATHHREVGEGESDEFLNVMKAAARGTALKYKEGGSAGGLARARVSGKKPGMGNKDLAECANATAILIRTKATGAGYAGKELFEIIHGKIDPKQLLPSAVYIIDAGFHVFVWIGKGASADEQDGALVYSELYLKGRQGGNRVPATTIRQGNETPLFCELFHGMAESAHGFGAACEVYMKGELASYPPGKARNNLVKSLHKAAQYCIDKESAAGGFGLLSIQGAGADIHDCHDVVEAGEIRAVYTGTPSVVDAIMARFNDAKMQYQAPGIKGTGKAALIETGEEEMELAKKITNVGRVQGDMGHVPAGMKAKMIEIPDDDY
jgi:hypothetical protein